MGRANYQYRRAKPAMITRRESIPVHFAAGRPCPISEIGITTVRECRFSRKKGGFWWVESFRSQLVTAVSQGRLCEAASG